MHIDDSAWHSPCGNSVQDHQAFGKFPASQKRTDPPCVVKPTETIAKRQRHEDHSEGNADANSGTLKISCEAPGLELSFMNFMSLPLDLREDIHNAKRSEGIGEAPPPFDSLEASTIDVSIGTSEQPP